MFFKIDFNYLQRQTFMLAQTRINDNISGFYTERKNQWVEF